MTGGGVISRGRALVRRTKAGASYVGKIHELMNLRSPTSPSNIPAKSGNIFT